MKETYEADEVARYIDLYGKMQNAAIILNSSLNLYDNSSPAQKALLSSPIRDFTRNLKNEIARFKYEVPKAVQEKISFGTSPDQLESLVTNTLLKKI